MATTMNATTASICPHNGTAHDGTLLCHWSNSPGARGTLNIFWLCISTLGLCVWNAVHPDVPRPNTPWWRVFGKRVWMLFVGLFMPEMLVLVALGQLRLAWQLLVDVDRKTRCPTEFPWWMYLVKSWRPENGNPDSPTERWMKALRRWMESLLRRLRVRSVSDAEKGKSVLVGEKDPSPLAAAAGTDDAPAHDSSKSSDTSQQAHNSPTPAVSDSEALGRAREHPWTLTHSFYAVMGGFVDGDGDAIDIRYIPGRLGLPPGDPERIEDVSLERSRRIELVLGDPERIPDVSIDDIEDRGKAGVLAKSLLVWQLFVFLVNCFARWDQSLALSLLEITTIGHSLCSIIAMVLWCGAEKIFPDEDLNLPRIVTIAAIAVLYGLPHLLGLSIHFPTFAEQLCWTVATSAVIGLPLVMCGMLWIMPYGDNLKLDGRMANAVGYSLFVLIIILLVLYPVASMFLVGESVRQIFALPVESFREPQLTTYLPSFS
ncbi:hypothetical protein EXIGLDRAFT_703441 [Exidia glandulosa HHB12029]|uniref:Uncharacterized protein n=1 Tax=Exidia glandulosa HHB12029 TaxID=1314781 RepID=A0A165C295_EXIGL|nr:hypothetical protein EXIGLDRAFT_703441 [Exidia glandulosa HHB12029]